MVTPDDFRALPRYDARSIIEEHVDACLRRRQLRIVMIRSGRRQEDVSAVHALYVAAGWSVELYPTPGVMMQFHNPDGTGDEVTKP
jgi:hypothetical protein